MNLVEIAGYESGVKTMVVGSKITLELDLPETGVVINALFKYSELRSTPLHQKKCAEQIAIVLRDCKNG